MSYRHEKGKRRPVGRSMLPLWRKTTRCRDSSSGNNDEVWLARLRKTMDQIPHTKAESTLAVRVEIHDQGSPTRMLTATTPCRSTISPPPLELLLGPCYTSMIHRRLQTKDTEEAYEPNQPSKTVTMLPHQRVELRGCQRYKPGLI